MPEAVIINAVSKPDRGAWWRVVFVRPDDLAAMILQALIRARKLTRRWWKMFIWVARTRQER
jgi:hypothetical protein